jgi:hypothetical protein
MITLRRLASVGTKLERACTAIIRVKMFKIGAAIMRNVRRVLVLLASQHPLTHVFLSAARASAPQSPRSAVPRTLKSNGVLGVASAIRPRGRDAINRSAISHGPTKSALIPYRKLAHETSGLGFEQ